MDEQHCMEMDAITAHLDRGWELLARGELEAARLSAAHIFKIDPDSPEGFTLLGAITVAEGDPQEALEHLRHALDLEPDYLDGMLYTAEVALHAIQDPELTLQLCDDAEEIAREPDDLLDLRLLRVEAQIARQRLPEARSAAAQLPEPPYPASGYYLRVGRAWLELEQPRRAIELLQRAIDDPLTAADAHYFMAVSLEKEQLPRQAMEHFMRVQELDVGPSAAELPPEVEGEVKRAVERTREELSPRLSQLLDRAPFEIREYPPREIIAEGFDPRGVVFLSGVPRQEHGDGASAGYLSCVFIYRKNLERLCPSESEWPLEILDSLERELSLFFGLSTEEEGP